MDTFQTEETAFQFQYGSIKSGLQNIREGEGEKISIPIWFD